MKILREYVWETLRQNKRSGAIIMTALFLMTSLMSCFCGLVYTMWTDAVVLEKWHNGDWHGELFDGAPGGSLEQIKNYASVSAVLIKGDWMTAKLPDPTTKPDRAVPKNTNPRSYLIFRGANQEYWDSMPEKNSITEGRVPASESELVLSKQYFEDHPGTHIGDTLTLPVGRRTYGGQPCEDTEPYREGEVFEETGTKTYTIVGVMDVTTSSAVPAYTGLTGLDEASILPDDTITVYLRFHPMRGTYRELPALARAIGYEPDEYGEYTLRYNTGLLAVHGILAPSVKGMPTHLSGLAIPLMFLLFAAFLVGVFVLVIHNAFVMSVNEKLVQLCTFAGVGATPKQIKKTVQSEALLLSALPLAPGLLAGWFLNLKLFQLINASNDLGRDAPDIVVTYGLPAILPAILLSLLTAWLSARIPAKKAAKMLPIEVLKQEGTFGKRSKFHFPGITGELAANAVSARRRSYRMATISLCLSFLLLTVFQYAITVNDANDAVFRTDPSESGHIFLSISDGREPDMEAIRQLKKVNGVTKSMIHDSMPCATWIDQADISEDINTNLGGIDQIIAKKKYSPIKRNGKYRIQSVIYGLEADSFRDYCEHIGVAPQPYFDDPSRAILYNYTKDPENSTRKHVLYRELLDIHEGQKLTFTEKNTDEIEGDLEFTITVGNLAKELPMETMGLSNFTLAVIMPMEHVLQLGESCCERRRNSTQVINGVFWTESKDSASPTAASMPDTPAIRRTTRQMEEVISSFYGSGDYHLTNLAEREELNQNTQNVLNLVVTFLTAFLAVIGLSNVWASISGNLRQRRQEFAMLKSVGLSPRQLWKLLLLEGLTLGLKPLLYSLPVQVIVLAALLTVTEISLPEYLPFAPYGVLTGYTVLILLAIVGAYAVGGIRLGRENIITMIKDDTL
ncbi:MAG: ABC transporter permease [Dorea sp.]|jgi:putative ABC transport system permease protein|nr:ABC transporter permease [Dorea sp.]